MISESSAVFASLADSVQHLRSDLENVQRELDQALGVWRAALIAERKEFQSLIQAQKDAWTQQDIQWQQEKATYEKKIHEAEEAFRKQLGQTEQNALRALNDLDDAWQRDKLIWNQNQSRRIKELENRETAWAKEQDKQQKALQELRDREVRWTAEREQQDFLIQKLQEQLTQMQSQEGGLENQTQAPEYFYQTTLESLEGQITVLHEMVNQISSAAAAAPAPTSTSSTTLVGHPMRRKSDLPYAFR